MARTGRPTLRDRVDRGKTLGMDTTPVLDPVLVAVPAFGRADLTDAVLDDLLDDPADLVPNNRVVVVDNRGDYEPRRTDPRLSVHRPGANLRWIGATNWALAEARDTGTSVCLVVNNDTRLSSDFVHRVALSFVECEHVALAAPCYDDFWLHQRGREIPSDAADYAEVHAYREVPFCDGTALAFSVKAVADLGMLDTVAFPRHGYGADIDLALRARAAGWRCVVTESAYLHHLRRGTMDLVPDAGSEQNRAEILTGMDAIWGDTWRARAGLGAGAFPAHNTGSSSSWYA